MGTQECINDNVVLGTLFELLKGSSHIQIWQLHNISHPSIHKIHMLGTHSTILPVSLSATLLFSIYWPHSYSSFLSVGYCNVQATPQWN